MTNGTIAWFNLDKGFGIITCDDGFDVFMPYSAVRDQNLRYPEAGQKVIFELRESQHDFMHHTGGLRASRVSLAS